MYLEKLATLCNRLVLLMTVSRDAVYYLRPMVLALPYSPKERSESSNMYYSQSLVRF